MVQIAIEADLLDKNHPFVELLTSWTEPTKTLEYGFPEDGPLIQDDASEIEESDEEINADGEEEKESSSGSEEGRIKDKKKGGHRHGQEEESDVDDMEEDWEQDDDQDESDVEANSDTSDSDEAGAAAFGDLEEDGEGVGSDPSDSDHSSRYSDQMSGENELDDGGDRDRDNEILAAGRKLTLMELDDAHVDEGMGGWQTPNPNRFQQSCEFNSEKGLSKIWIYFGGFRPVSSVLGRGVPATVALYEPIFIKAGLKWIRHVAVDFHFNTVDFYFRVEGPITPHLVHRLTKLAGAYSPSLRQVVELESYLNPEGFIFGVTIYCLPEVGNLTTEGGIRRVTFYAIGLPDSVYPEVGGRLENFFNKAADYNKEIVRTVGWSFGKGSEMRIEGERSHCGRVMEMLRDWNTDPRSDWPAEDIRELLERPTDASEPSSDDETSTESNDSMDFSSLLSKDSDSGDDSDSTWVPDSDSDSESDEDIDSNEIYDTHRDSESEEGDDEDSEGEEGEDELDWE